MSTAAEFKFLGYRVSSIQMEIDEAFMHQKEEMEQNITVTPTFDTQNPNQVVVQMDTRVASKSKLFQFNLTIQGAFQANERFPEELFEKLAQQNAPAILFPFIRSIISTYTAQANIPPIILPTINFTIDSK